MCRTNASIAARLHELLSLRGVSHADRAEWLSLVAECDADRASRILTGDDPDLDVGELDMIGQALGVHPVVFFSQPAHQVDH